MVIGKYFAALTVFAVTFLVNSFNFVLLFLYGSPNLASIFANIFGLFLIGCAFIAIGCFLSALTENQLIAAVTSIGTIAAVILISLVANEIGITWVRVVLKWFSIINRYAPFTNQQLDITAIVYFISLSAVFLFLTVRVYEKRRWA
jgi:ABC-2 type transport system permease protein